MSDDFDRDALFKDIDKIMQQQGYSTITPPSAPVEVAPTVETQHVVPTMPSNLSELVEKAAAQTISATGQTAQVNPTTIQPAQANPAAGQSSFGQEVLSPQSGVSYFDPVEINQTVPKPQAPTVNPVREPEQTPVSETIMPPDTEAAPMFTTIDNPMDWSLQQEPSESKQHVAPEKDDRPPVSYLEGAQSDGYSVENVAFGDISVGVETESVEFSVGHPLLRLLRNILICVAAALILSILITKFVAHHTAVDGSSMQSTLSDGDQLIVEQLSYYFHDPQRFDVVVFPISSEDNYIKRIIGLPGETVQIIDGQVYINGNLLTDDHYGMEKMDDPGIAAETIYLKEGEYFVLGDNRNASVDSRFADVGLIKRDDIKGRAWLRFYPFGSFGIVK